MLPPPRQRRRRRCLLRLLLRLLCWLLRLLVPLPEGSGPGHTVGFSATMPPASLRMPCAIAKLKAGTAADFEVHIPPQLTPGERFKALLPDAEAILVTVPPGGTPGSLLSFRAAPAAR